MSYYDAWIFHGIFSGHYAPQLAAHVVDYMAEFGTSVINLIGVGVSFAFSFLIALLCSNTLMYYMNF